MSNPLDFHKLVNLCRIRNLQRFLRFFASGMTLRHNHGSIRMTGLRER
jgi:hypothetical protein